MLSSGYSSDYLSPSICTIGAAPVLIRENFKLLNKLNFLFKNFQLEQNKLDHFRNPSNAMAEEVYEGAIGIDLGKVIDPLFFPV